jgi:hypothetical protein
MFVAKSGIYIDINKYLFKEFLLKVVMPEIGSPMGNWNEHFSR